MTTQSTFPMNDLVLRLTGGQRDGELIPVSTPKCYLGMEEPVDGGEQPQCAIFRGPKGAAVKSYAGDVLVNGVASSVHWLKEGDRIEFPNSVSLEVAQLGWVEQECEEHAASEFEIENESDEPSVYEASDHELNDQEANDHSQSSENVAVSEPVNDGCDDPYYQPVSEQQEQEQPCESAESQVEIAPAETPVVESSKSNDDYRLDLIESQINEIKADRKQTAERLCELDEELLTLTEKMSQLVSIAAGEQSNECEPKRVEFDAKDEVETQEVESLECESPEVESLEADQYGSLSEYYSHADDDDEKIMTFDASEQSEELPAATNVVVEDAPAELSGVSREEIEARQSELEKVFGGALGDGSNDDSEVILSPSMTETAEHTADEQPAESFETPTHGLNDEAASSADYTTDTEPEAELQPGSLASQLLSEVQADEAESFEEETVEEEVVVEADSTDEEASQSGGVADLLARMKAEGKWDGVPEGDEEPESFEPVSQPVVADPVEPVAEEKDDVQDYMSQLLTRMRGDSPPSEIAPTASKSTKTPKPSAENSEESEEPDFVPPANPLKPEEFKPMRKAQKFSLSAMRELANSTAKSNVRKSEDKNRKELGYLQMGIAVCSFFMAIFYFLIQSVAFMDTGFIVGLVCVGISGYLGYRFYTAMKYNELIESTSKSKETASEEAELAAPEAS